MVKVIKFKGDPTYYGRSKEEELAQWTKGMDKSSIISLTYTDYEIVMFYWED